MQLFRIAGISKHGLYSVKSLNGRSEGTHSEFGVKMLSRNQWGGALEIHDESPENEELDRDLLFSNELSSTMFLAAQNQMRKEKYVDLGCIVCKLRFVRTIFLFSLVCLVIVGIPIIVYKSLVRHNQSSPPRDEYAISLQKALVFFNAQRYLTQILGMLNQKQQLDNN
ncbi:hypothetical protein M5K25_009202 [Dendrobium thyrsiflorum]|uniref:Uncharacterized protein n=1 Tax=Dendrobium thyrsiflorum TaxID=117978 RepID=A0ABD0V591_DENTH